MKSPKPSGFLKLLGFFTAIYIMPASISFRD